MGCLFLILSCLQLILKEVDSDILFLTSNLCFCSPAHPKGGGFSSLRGLGHLVPPACRRSVVPASSLQRYPAGRHGAGARGATHRLVQPLRPPPLLWQDGHQLWSHAHEHDTHQGHILQGNINFDQQRSPLQYIQG